MRQERSLPTKKPIPASARLCQVVALLAAALPAAAAQAPDATVVLFGAELSTGPTTTQPVLLNGLANGADVGWAVAGRLDVGQLFSRSALFGRLSSDGGAAKLLRVPSTIAGWTQQHLLEPSPADGRLAYIESLQPFITTSTGGGRSVWTDDQLLARSGDPIGVTQRDWSDFRDIVHLASGDTYVLGGFSSAQGSGDTVALYPGPTDILGTGDSIAGLPSPVATIRELRVSPDGAHWVAHVGFGTGPRGAIVVDGALYSLGGGHLAYQWGTAPDSFAGPGGTFGSFGAIAINNEGDVAFSTFILTPGGGVPLIVRNTRPVESAPTGVVLDQLEAMDPRGFVATRTPNATVEVAVDSLFASSALSTVDIDADGVADLGWSLLEWASPSELAFSSDGAQLYVQTQLLGPQGEQPFAVVRLNRYGAAQSICAGQPNSTGHPARITALGSREVPAGDLALSCIELPSASAGMFIVSQTTGFQPNAGGSSGDLCLAGTIGRYNQTPFVSGPDGRADLTLDLLSIPQANGAVAATAGSTWYFQSWYRDAPMGQPTSKFSDAIRVQLR